MSEAETKIRAALRERYAAPAWAYLEEVANSTSGHKRSADAVAFGLWKSRGMEIHGFEIKVHRSDWRKEVRSPEKAEPIARFCHRWWVVVSDESLVRDGELPPGWGLMSLVGKSLGTIVQAPRREPDPIEYNFVAAALRRATEFWQHTVPKDEVDAIVQARVEERLAAELRDGLGSASPAVQRELAILRRANEEAKSMVDAIGLDRFHSWKWGKWRKLIDVFDEHGPQNYEEAMASVRTALDYQARSLAMAQAHLGEMIASLDGVEKDNGPPADPVSGNLFNGKTPED